MIIAVDFDGTIVEHKYPAIGKELPFATATLRQLIKDGHKLILWSVREGELLEEAIQWCEDRGVRFYSANANIDEDPGEDSKSTHYSRKLKADMFIDDRNVGGLPDWGTIYQLICQRMTYEEYIQAKANDSLYDTKKKKPWWKF